MDEVVEVGAGDLEAVVSGVGQAGLADDLADVRKRPPAHHRDVRVVARGAGPQRGAHVRGQQRVRRVIAKPGEGAVVVHEERQRKTREEAVPLKR